VFGDNIVNYSANEFRGVDLRAQLHHSVDPKDAIARLRPRIAAITNVAPAPAPVIEILEFNAAGTLLVVRPFCHNANYWQVYFDVNRTIGEVFGEARYPVPEQRTAMRQVA
jgi:small conductance mechanosensitive channel